MNTNKTEKIIPVPRTLVDYDGERPIYVGPVEPVNLWLAVMGGKVYTARSGGRHWVTIRVAGREVQMEEGVAPTATLRFALGELFAVCVEGQDDSRLRRMLRPFYTVREDLLSSAGVTVPQILNRGKWCRREYTSWLCCRPLNHTGRHVAVLYAGQDAPRPATLVWAEGTRIITAKMHALLPEGWVNTQ